MDKTEHTHTDTYIARRHRQTHTYADKHIHTDTDTHADTHMCSDSSLKPVEIVLHKEIGSVCRHGNKVTADMCGSVDL